MPRRTITSKPKFLPTTSLQRGVLAVFVGIIIAIGIHLTGGSRAATIPGDLNGDGTVNVFDLSILLANWGATGTGGTPTPTATPTPTSTPA